MTAVPACVIVRMMPKRLSVSSAVREAVGSSMMMIFASRENALAISTSCCWAAERAETRAPGARGMDRRSRISRAESSILFQSILPRGRGLAAQEDVLGHRDFLDQEVSW